MYQKYHTEALVLGGNDAGESDRTLVLLTRDFGLVKARATAVRSERSKMRYALQHYSRSYVSLVKGKRGWRVAGATAVRIPSRESVGISTFARIAELAMRLTGSDEKNEYLFDALAEAHTTLLDKYSSQTAVFPTVEIVCVARVLFALGYLSAEALQTTLFTHTAYGDEHLQEAEVLKETMLKSINRAIAETHL
ncbi:recombination protein O N-terminal domain-containing protein [Candidatus Kaiserbacteria bacterium]|nr:recombination protein O N-terminal domain-containing protein [Candidatus Kaiserbacteria bacterium]